MKALYVESERKIFYGDIPIRELADDEVLCRVSYCGICGTDLSIYSGETNLVRDGLIKYPVRIGHEWSGIVEETGPKVSGFVKGDRVVSDNGVACRTCPDCLAGNYHLCKNIKSLGTINCWDGAMAEYIIMPECHLYHIPDSVTQKAAALTEPMTIAYAGILKYPITPNSTVAVIGTGSIGMSAVAIATYLGVKQIICIGRNNSKLAVAKAMGATHTINSKNQNLTATLKEITQNRGVDFVLETSGASETVQQSLDIAAIGGTLSIIGFYEKPLEHIEFNRLVTKGLSMYGIMGKMGSLTEILNMIEKIGNENIEKMITRCIKLSEAPEYFEKYTAGLYSDIKVLAKP